MKLNWSRPLPRAILGAALAVAVGAGGWALFQPPRLALAATCGEPGLPPCPLQSFMRNKIAAPLAQKDMTALAAGLDRVGTMQPDQAWTSWGTFASAGASAARANDIVGVRAACKGCHDAWRPAYRKDYRLRPLP